MPADKYDCKRSNGLSYSSEVYTCKQYRQKVVTPLNALVLLFGVLILLLISVLFFRIKMEINIMQSDIDQLRRELRSCKCNPDKSAITGQSVGVAWYDTPFEEEDQEEAENKANPVESIVAPSDDSQIVLRRQKRTAKQSVRHAKNTRKGRGKKNKRGKKPRRGEKGEKGDKGDQGDRGERGEKGEPAWNLTQLFQPISSIRLAASIPKPGPKATANENGEIVVGNHGGRLLGNKYRPAADGIFKDWQTEYQNSGDGVCSYDSASGSVKILKPGVYYMYSQITCVSTNNSFDTCSVGIHVNDKLFVKCLESTASKEHRQTYRACHTTAAKRLNKDDVITVRDQYSEGLIRFVFFQPDSSFWGIIRLSD